MRKRDYLHFAGIPQGMHTWGYKVDGTYIPHIGPGVKIPADELRDAAGYVERGQAVVIQLDVPDATGPTVTGTLPDEPPGPTKGAKAPTGT